MNAGKFFLPANAANAGMNTGKSGKSYLFLPAITPYPPLSTLALNSVKVLRCRQRCECFASKRYEAARSGAVAHAQDNNGNGVLFLGLCSVPGPLPSDCSCLDCLMWDSRRQKLLVVHWLAALRHSPLGHRMPTPERVDPWAAFAGAASADSVTFWVGTRTSECVSVPSP